MDIIINYDIPELTRVMFEYLPRPVSQYHQREAIIRSINLFDMNEFEQGFEILNVVCGNYFPHQLFI